MKQGTNLKNLLFDLGDVLLDLNFPEADRRFRALLGSDFEGAYQGSRGLFRQLELGQLAEAEFLAGFRRHCRRPLTDADLLEAWNTILGGLPAHRLRMLEELSGRYDLYLLSNTNALHMTWFDRYLTATHGLGLAEFAGRYFRGFYLSYQIGLSKPDPAVFQHVLRRSGLKAEETLFIDDRAENIRAAEALGIRGYLHDPRRDIAEALPGFLSQ